MCSPFNKLVKFHSDIFKSIAQQNSLIDTINPLKLILDITRLKFRPKKANKKYKQNKQLFEIIAKIIIIYFCTFSRPNRALNHFLGIVLCYSNTTRVHATETIHKVNINFHNRDQNLSYTAVMRGQSKPVCVRQCATVTI